MLRGVMLVITGALVGTITLGTLMKVLMMLQKSWGDSGMGWIEKILCKVLPYTDIMRDDTNDIYLRRFFVYPRDKDFGKNKGKGRIYLHKFYRGDEDAHLHTHPWPFTSLILTRGYWEETLWTPLNDLRKYMPTFGPNDEWRNSRFYPRFSVLRRPATWAHRVILKDEKPVWTLVRTGVKERSWGFIIDGIQCYWRDYKNGVCWCNDDVNESPASTGAAEVRGGSEAGNTVLR